MFVAALFIIDKIWKQPRCLSVDEWINKLWYIQIMGYYSALERNEPSNHKEIWKKHKCILLGEKSQYEKATYLVQYESNYMTSEKEKTVDKKDQQLPGFGGEGGINRQSTEDFLGSEIILYVAIMVNYMSLYT